MFGTEIWPAAEYGRTMYTIRQRIGPLLMKMEKRYGQLSIVLNKSITNRSTKDINKSLFLKLADDLYKSEFYYKHTLIFIYKYDLCKLCDCFSGKTDGYGELTEKELIRAERNSGVVSNKVREIQVSEHLLAANDIILKL